MSGQNGISGQNRILGPNRISCSNRFFWGRIRFKDSSMLSLGFGVNKMNSGRGLEIRDEIQAEKSVLEWRPGPSFHDQDRQYYMSVTL